VRYPVFGAIIGNLSARTAGDRKTPITGRSDYVPLTLLHLLWPTSTNKARLVILYELVLSRYERAFEYICLVYLCPRRQR